MPVVVIAPHDAVFEKTVSNMQEVEARGGRIVLRSMRRKEAAVAMEHILPMPDMGHQFCAHLSTPPQSRCSPITPRSLWVRTPISPAISPNP